MSITRIKQKNCSTVVDAVDAAAGEVNRLSLELRNFWDKERRASIFYFFRLRFEFFRCNRRFWRREAGDVEFLTTNKTRFEVQGGPRSGKATLLKTIGQVDYELQLHVCICCQPAQQECTSRQISPSCKRYLVIYRKLFRNLCSFRNCRTLRNERVVNDT